MSFSDMPKLPLVIIAVMVVFGALLYPQLPAHMPMHWGVGGEINGWATKSVGSVFALPILGVVLYLVLWVVPYLDSLRRNIVRAKDTYALIVDLAVALIAITYFAQLYTALGHALPMNGVLDVSLGLTLIVLGSSMRRFKRNRIVGVRLRWTLADDEVWEKTNRLGGHLLMASGALAVLGGFLPPLVGLWLVVLPVLAALPVLSSYAKRLYEERHPDEIGPPTLESIAERERREEVPVLREGDPNVEHVQIRCPACGADNAPDDTRCVLCGKRLPRR